VFSLVKTTLTVFSRVGSLDLVEKQIPGKIEEQFPGSLLGLFHLTLILRPSRRPGTLFNELVVRGRKKSSREVRISEAA
jgi:hypothetical protein